MLEVTILLIIMVIGSILALEVKDLLSAVIITGAVGLCLSVGFVLLKAPDLAMTQLVVEIALVMILLRATVKHDKRITSGKKGVGIYLGTALGMVLFLYCAYLSIEKLPIFGKPLLRISRTYFSDAVDATGVMNLVSAITLDYRVFDTFAAMLVLFAGIIGVLVVSRKYLLYEEKKSK